MSENQSKEQKGWSRATTLRFLAAVLCGVDALLYLLGGKLIGLLVGFCFVASAIALKRNVRWGASLAATTLVIALLYEFMLLLGGEHLIVGIVGRILLHVALSLLLLFGWSSFQRPGDRQDIGGRGAV